MITAGCVVGAFYCCIVVALVLMRFRLPPTSALELQRRLEAGVGGRPIEIQKSYVSLDEIPSHVGLAVVAAEDPNFFRHHGVDWWALRAKTRMAFKQRTPFAGASTLTQQLIKNLFLPNCRSYTRKAVEMTVVPFVEVILPKQRILELYLNSVEWGPGIFGVGTASQHYYGVAASSITREQAARLAAILPNPKLRNPAEQHYTSQTVLNRMTAYGW